jgi:DNA-binding transcriptional MerR regulator
MEEAKGSPEQQRIPIGEFARRAGVTAQTVRYYEQLGLLNSPSRPRYGKRTYTFDDLYVLLLIRKAKALGLSLAEIKELGEIFRQDPTEKGVILKGIELLESRLRDLEMRRREVEDVYTMVSREIARLRGLLVARKLVEN